MPANLLSRIEGVVLDMERQVEEEDKYRQTALHEALHGNLLQGVNCQKCKKCGTALVADSDFCQQCGWQCEHVVDVVDVLGQRLALLEKRREAAELRSSQLTELRRIVSEGRHQNHSPLSDSSFRLGKKGRGGRDDGDASVADTYNMSTVLTGSEEEEGDETQTAEVLSELEAKFSQELEAAGESNARSRLQDRLQSLMQAILRRERAMQDRLEGQQAMIEEHRLSAEAAAESQRAAEQDLKVLDEHSQTVLKDCRALQAQLQQLEHSKFCKKCGCDAAAERDCKTEELQETLHRQQREFELQLQERENQQREFELQLQEKEKLLEITQAREADLKERLAQLEANAQSMTSSIKKHAADRQRMHMLELEQGELISCHERKQQALKDQIQEVEREHAETKERLCCYAKQHGELKGALADLEGQLAKAEEKSAEHARRTSEALQRLEMAKEEIETQRQRIAEMEGEVQESKDSEQRISKQAAAVNLASSEQIAYLEGLLADEQQSRVELDRKYHEHTQAHASSFSDLQHQVQVLEAELHQERETNKALLVELLEVKDQAERERRDLEQMIQRRTHDEACLEELEHHNALLNDQFQKEPSKSTVGSTPLRFSPGTRSEQRPSISSTGSGADDFRQKVKAVKCRAAELLRKAAEPHCRFLELELAASVSGWRQGHSLQEGSAKFYVGKAEALQERQALASLVEAAEHDLRVLKEEASTHHELSPHELQETLQQIDLDVQCCCDERKLLQITSPLADLPEELLQGIAASLGLLYSERPRSLGLSHWPDRQTPMHWAAQNGRRDIVEFLLRHEGGKDLVNLPDGQGRTPLQLAESQQQVTLCHYLRERAGATTERKQSQVIMAISGTQVQEDVRPTSDDDLPDKYQAVLARVEQQGWDNVTWKDGFTILHWAASKGEVNLCHHLVSMNADPEAKDSIGRTALDCAEAGGHAQAADMLKFRIRNRLLSRLSTRSRSLEHSLSPAALNAVPTTRRASTRRKSVILPETYLPVLEEIDRVGWQNMTWAHGFTLLHWAAKNDAPELVDKFMSQGADPLQADDSGRTALDYARYSGSLAVVAALQRHAPPLAAEQA
eukprot:TRINITY_DN5269_c0_g2_i1.p1 TRINITY_DN5269_c0_g2~~TRINITY_DN5269_c0_g2_i1.p1  ORF type:complete len:1259 (+),score=305.47 TRINITY_DN5269_c0_g2_i1:523-3777(+)